MVRASFFLRMIGSVVWGPLWIGVLHSLWKKKAPRQGAWVIGGHRGRHYGDNPAGVEAAARGRGKRILWLANPEWVGPLRARGVTVLCRQSWRARKAISQASLLIYSHGEDDLDLLMVFLRGKTCSRIYLGHSLSLLKAGGVLDPSLRRELPPVRWLKTWLITRWDYVLCASEKERDNFRACYPMNPGSEEAARLAGGAHLDEWTQGLTQPVKKHIYWFPTFRDTPPARQNLQRIIQEVIQSSKLRSWLRRSGYRLLIGVHINDKRGDFEVNEPVALAPLRTLTEDVRTSALLISDYSGVVYDFLVLERPQILFEFDRDDYERHRDLYGNYNSLRFALHAKTVDQLVDMIVTEQWRDEALVEAARAHKKEYLPPPAKSYAQLSVDEMERIETEGRGMEPGRIN